MNLRSVEHITKHEERLCELKKFIVSKAIVPVKREYLLNKSVARKKLNVWSCIKKVKHKVVRVESLGKVPFSTHKLVFSSSIARGH